MCGRIGSCCNGLAGARAAASRRVASCPLLHACPPPENAANRAQPVPLLAPRARADARQGVNAHVGPSQAPLAPLSLRLRSSFATAALLSPPPRLVLHTHHPRQTETSLLLLPAGLIARVVDPNQTDLQDDLLREVRERASTGAGRQLKRQLTSANASSVAGAMRAARVGFGGLPLYVALCVRGSLCIDPQTLAATRRSRSASSTKRGWRSS
jgi:hypothetical protein